MHVLFLLVNHLNPGRFNVHCELDTDVVVPTLLAGPAAHLSREHDPHTARRRPRSLDASGGSSWNTGDILVALPAFGRRLVLNLTQDTSFLWRDFVVEERRGEDAELRRVPPEQLCFYSGSVLNHSGSVASISTCGGLVSSVFPVQSFSGQKHKVQRQRRSAPEPSLFREQTSSCGTGPVQRGLSLGVAGRRRRHSIGVHEAYTVETVVVADSDMVQYHGAEAAQRFLLTVMNMVYNMFQHQSLGARINIRVTKLLLLHNRPAKLKVSHHGERSLESFCHWQYHELGTRHLGTNYLPGARDDVPVDAAVLVTRYNTAVIVFPRFDTYLDTWCVLAEDNGLNLAFTIAHELGHNMGMSHDDDHASCTGHSHIMSGEWVKGRNPSDLSWSSCSRDDLENFLRSKASACLLHTDPRSRYQVRLSPKLPGMHYSVDEQCQILFGTNATFCTDMEHLMCAGLWCMVEGDSACKTKLDPPLDGTECGVDKWCRAGECVIKSPIPQHIDGDWSPWSQWSMCSRTCGTGVQFRQRKCDNPPPGPGGRHCQKASVEHKACESPPCPKGAPSFRDLQCLSHDRQFPLLKSSMMTAIVNDEKPCVLFCSPVGRSVPVLVSERVMDGTPCGPYEADLCVNGRCQKIGCDGIIGSAAKEDRCGVCNGDGRSCRVVRGDFNHTKGMALKDSGKKSINSDWKIELPGEFEVAGTTVRYVRRGLWEKMSAKGPTTLPLHLMVRDPGWIHLPHPAGHSFNEFSMMYAYFILTVVSCMRLANKSMEVVSDSFCQPENRPLPQVRPCNSHPCQYRWVTGEWGSCSVTCGKGLQQREVGCVYQLQNGSLIHTRDLYCQSGKPPGVQACEGRLCLNVWEASEWSKCSSDCGEGVRSRTVLCTNPQGLCDPLSRPPHQEPCQDHSQCYEWKTGDWSKCSSSCGKGLQSRVVQCMHRVTGRHGDECPVMLRPPAYRPCHLDTCNQKVNVNTITSPRLAALTYKCRGDQWAVYCRVVREKNLCQDMRWYQRCCQTCRDFYANKSLLSPD
uniref:Uncharacterized protein n=1 Tax=Periophthalmus magnuspinnatus TaxID=409849 RepID=A0A3B4AHZ0_9GOBI